MHRVLIRNIFMFKHATAPISELYNDVMFLAYYANESSVFNLICDSSINW